MSKYYNPTGINIPAPNYKVGEYSKIGESLNNLLNGVRDRERQDFKEAEARRLMKLQEEREQYKFDKEVNTDKALIDFQNQIGRASAGGAMSDQQGAQLGDEFDRLLKTVGEEEAARIINEKAQKFGAQDAKRAEDDPYYRAELIKGVSLPSGNIDPKSLIDLRNSQIIRNEALGQRKDDLAIRAKEREEDLWFKKQELAMRQAERNERAREKEDAKKALNEMYARSMTPDSNISPDGGRYKITEENTKNKTIPNGVSIPEGEGSKELSEIEEISNRIISLYNKNRDKNGKEINYENRDEALKAFIKENPEAANSSAVGKVVDRAFEGAVKNVSDGMINGMSLPGKILAVGLDKAKPLFMTDIEKEEYNKKLDEAKAKELQESLKSNSPGNKANDVNISFDNYLDLKKKQQDSDNEELGKLQEELEKKSLTYYNNAANKYGVDEVKTIKTLMTPEEARNDAATKTADALNKKGVAPDYVLKYAYEAGEKAHNLQASLISNAVKEGKESAKNKNENRKETTKTINDEIKTLEKYKLKIGESREKEIWYDSKLLKISEAQELIDNEVSRLKKELAELK